MAYNYNYLKMIRGYQEPDDTFQERLKLFMERYHLNSRQMADFANLYARRFSTKVTVSDINNYLKGRCCPKIDKFQAISNAMGIDVAFFAGYLEKDIRSRLKMLQRREKMTAEEIAKEKKSAYAYSSKYQKFEKAYAMVEKLIHDGEVHRPGEIKSTLLHCGYSPKSAENSVPAMMNRFNALRTKEGYKLQ